MFTQPHEDRLASSRTRQRLKPRAVLHGLTGLLVLLLLAACGSNSFPLAGVKPSTDGNLVLRVTPPDAEVVVSEDAEVPTGAGARAKTVSGGVGELRYRLAPGEYAVFVTRSGYRQWEGRIEIPADEEAEEDAEVVHEVELVPEPDSSTPSDPDGGDGSGGGDGGSDGGGDGGSVVGPRGLSLRGNPSFDRSKLSEEQRLWYDRLWAAARHPDQTLDAESMAASDNAYHYGRALFSHNQSLLLGLRATGDLAFLDEVDGLAQEMRDNLYDGWCDGVSDSVDAGSMYGTVNGEDTFLNYRRRYDEGHKTYCRDSGDLEEGLIHGHIAMLMYAYHVNRDLESPAGIDYGERADFWLEYLREHFEAKWRERADVDFPDMDFLNVRFCHTQATMTLFYYYVGQRLQDDGNSQAGPYLDKAREMTDEMFEIAYRPGEMSGGFMPASTPYGDAVVYSFGSPGWRESSGSTNLEACPSTYMRYMVAAQVQMDLDGFYKWDDGIMSKVANGAAYFVFDSEDMDSSRPFAAGVTGDETIAGIPPTEYRDRLTLGTFGISSIANLAGWDESGRIAEISLLAYDALEGDTNNPRRVHIPASMLLKSSM